ncbi:right-handed parallel beta-helix repeat-containing protein [uncultured Friedmanniella sp.]|uniref:right-handed parallel beta-helix repeat-containing protein n=1 Tax=uncultured Friedmanniella sp. TaxID=335381 RepID=UPI0035CA7E8F
MTTRTTDQGIVIYDSGDPATILGKGMPVGDTVDAALKRYAATVAQANTARDQAVAAAAQAAINAGSAAGDPATSAAISSLVSGKIGRTDLHVDVQRTYTVPIDGVVDARASLNTAFNANAGRRMLLGAGVYYLTSRINTIGQGTIIEGLSPAQTILDVAGAAFAVTSNDVLVRNVTIRGYSGAKNKSLFQAAAAANFKNWRFENCVFDGVAAIVAAIGAVNYITGTAIAAGSSEATGIGSFIEFDHCEFKNTTLDGGGVYAKGVLSLTINRCWFHNMGTSTGAGDMVKMAYSSEDWRILDSIFEDGTRDAIDTFDGRRGTIRGNTMRRMQVHAIEVKCNAPTSGTVDRILVDGNRSYSCSLSSATTPVFQMAAPYLQVVNNYSEASGGLGFRSGKMLDGVTPVKGVIFANNMAMGSQGSGFLATGTDYGQWRGNYSEGSVAGKGFDVPTASNTHRQGDATTNQSVGNAVADTWT